MPLETNLVTLEVLKYLPFWSPIQQSITDTEEQTGKTIEFKIIYEVGL